MGNVIRLHRDPAMRSMDEDDPHRGPDLRDVVLQQVTTHGWQVCDGRLPRHHPFRLLGFIEFGPDALAVMQLGRGCEWTTFRTLDDAVAHLVSTSTPMTRARIAGELSWLP